MAINKFRISGIVRSTRKLIWSKVNVLLKGKTVLIKYFSTEQLSNEYKLIMGGKKKSLAVKLAKMTDEERARYLQHRAEIEEEAKRRKEQLVSTFLKVRLTFLFF